MTLFVLLFNLARIIDVALFIRHHSHLNLLECWCWTAISSCVPPASHRGHLASVQGLGGGGEANGGNGGGEGQGQGQKQYGEIEICILIVVSWVYSDLGDVSSVNLRISCVVLPNKNLHRIKEMNKHIVELLSCYPQLANRHYKRDLDIINICIKSTVGGSENVAACYDGASTEGGHLSCRHQAHLQWII